MSAEEAAPANGTWLRHPALPYVAPFAVFVGFLAIGEFLPFRLEWNYGLRFGAVLAVLTVVSRGVMPRTVPHALGSVLLGIGVFVLWIGPDVLWPGYHEGWLFNNRLMGAPKGPLSAGVKTNTTFIIFRVLASVGNVPVLEELFWRGWLMRWLIATDFRKVPLGAYTAASFWIVAVLFAAEHGSYWDVGLIAGILYNWWMVRTRSLGDCMLAHAVTNACLAWYVLARDQWQYWF